MSAKAREHGLNAAFVNSMYERYGKSPQAAMLCSILGVKPEALRDDMLKIAGGDTSNNSQPMVQGNRFPRLK